VRVHVVSDVHGNADALARAGEGADALLVLGDLLDFVDYHDHSQGILGTIFGADKVATFAELRRNRQGSEIAAYARSLFAAMTAPTYATPGNVDAPALWPEFAGRGVHILDGEVAKIGELRFGFAGGALLPPGAVLRSGATWRPYLRTEEEFGTAVAGLGEVDVVCTHVPPAVPELTYDVVARRPERGSAALLDAIMRHRPRWSLFGHVHQPLAQRARVGRTECVNVGHFKRTGRPYVLRW
jgi:Icc-related predicted phosphoesterase